MDGLRYSSDDPYHRLGPVHIYINLVRDKHAYSRDGMRAHVNAVSTQIYVCSSFEDIY